MFGGGREEASAVGQASIDESKVEPLVGGGRKIFSKICSQKCLQ